MTTNMYIATGAWLMLVLGVFARKTRRVHVPCMLVGIATDIALVLYLQVTREAIQTALSFKLELLKQIHIGLSTVALVLYFPVLYLGFRLLQGKGSYKLRMLHIRVAVTAFFFRCLGFMFMFSMLKH